MISQEKIYVFLYFFSLALYSLGFLFQSYSFSQDINLIKSEISDGRLYLSNKFDFFINSLNRVPFYYNGRQVNFSSIPVGFYIRDNYYCVYTKNRSNLEIKNTYIHENCHDLIFKDYTHFCT